MDAEGLNKLLTGAKEGELADIATEDDTLYSIAARHGTTARWLERLNPQFVDNYLHGGDKVIISQEISFLQIKVIKTETSTVPVKYEVVNTNSDKYYKGEQKITTKGVPGEEIVTKIVTYVNGVVTASEEIDRVRTKAPVTEQVLIGSKSTRVVTTKGEVIIINPSAQGFVWPTPQLSTITSPYGYRSSGFHTGMDISGSGASGKLVVAAKDGTVESVTRSGSGYGNQIVINHGNGVKTRYAHLYTGSMSVSPGDRVTAGQPIARVGSTGNSTGPHLHFEVIINGKTQNPKNYLKMP
ncbi:MAG: M23 family metallopeptidase [Oscillospiraceae bacterium]|nr:M23 family metallopeptidase [Oscillospiraceae bacterium]